MMIPTNKQEPTGIVEAGSLLLTICLLFIAAVSNTAYAQGNRESNDIAVLFHTSNLSTFKQEFGFGLRTYLESVQSDFPALDVSYEFLGLDNFPAQSRPGVLIDFLKHNQQLNPARVIISVLGSSAEFLLTYGDEIYGDLPKVYRTSK